MGRLTILSSLKFTGSPEEWFVIHCGSPQKIAENGVVMGRKLTDLPSAFAYFLREVGQNPVLGYGFDRRPEFREGGKTAARRFPL
jgi:hypothetical protein